MLYLGSLILWIWKILFGTQVALQRSGHIADNSSTYDITLDTFYSLPFLKVYLIPSSWHFSTVGDGWSSQRLFSLVYLVATQHF